MEIRCFYRKHIVYIIFIIWCTSLIGKSHLGSGWPIQCYCCHIWMPDTIISPLKCSWCSPRNPASAIIPSSTSPYPTSNSILNKNVIKMTQGGCFIMGSSCSLWNNSKTHFYFITIWKPTSYIKALINFNRCPKFYFKRVCIFKITTGDRTLIVRGVIFLYVRSPSCSFPIS